MSWKGINPKDFPKAIERDVSKKAREAAMEILRNLTFVSPIDTGRFINNWLVGIGTKNNRTLKGTRGDPISRGNKVLLTHTKFKEIWISNNLKYAVPLNNGHSGQAPANFVEKAVAQVRGK